jgi:hypothetical protein
MVTPVDEKAHISQEIEDTVDQETERRRQAWRALLIPAVGSAAFFGTTLANAIKTYRKQGWPGDAFTSLDYLLIALPVAMFVIAIGEGTNGNTQTSSTGE